MDPINYLTVELLTLLYPMYLYKKNTFPLIMLIIIIIHGLRFDKHVEKINKKFQPNFLIFILYVILVIGLFYFKNFVLFGIFFGILQYKTYEYHQQQSNNQYEWVKIWIDIPITILSLYISYIGYITNNLYLAPFFGDFVYHILEYYNKSK